MHLRATGYMTIWSGGQRGGESVKKAIFLEELENKAQFWTCDELTNLFAVTSFLSLSFSWR
jgi:hypothetical protein